MAEVILETVNRKASSILQPIGRVGLQNSTISFPLLCCQGSSDTIITNFSVCCIFIFLNYRSVWKSVYMLFIIISIWESLSESLSTVYSWFPAIWLNDICIAVYFALGRNTENEKSCTLCLVACESAIYFCRPLQEVQLEYCTVR